MNKLFFTIPGHPIPAVRTTGRQMFADLRYKAYREYKERIKAIVTGKILSHRVPEIKGEAAIDIKIFRLHRRGDIDNFCKSVMDGIQDSGLYRNDNQVKKLTAEIIEKSQEERIEVLLEWN